MGSKDRMRSLSERLEPIRNDFKLRLYQKSLPKIEQQVCDDFSLFWSAPSRVISNLHRLFENQTEDQLRFFLIRHACAHRRSLSHLGLAIPPVDELEPLVWRCIDPNGSDAEVHGLLPLSTPVPRLGRRKLHRAIKSNLLPEFQESTDPADPSKWLYEATIGPWRIAQQIATSSDHFQVEFNFDVLLGMGDLWLDRQLSLHRLFGVGPSAWDLVEPGQEDDIACLAGEYGRFMLGFFSEALKDLDPGISAQEVAQAEQEWIEWLTERRATRKPR
jgi:hypothetical protein